MRYCLIGRSTKEPLSYRGYILVHDNKSEMEYLFPKERVAPLPKHYGDDLTMALTEHPDIKGIVLFPLEKNMNQFRK